MERPEAIREIREVCHQLAAGVTSIHRLTPGLADQATQDEIFKAAYELTKSVEVLKKQLLKLERRDESSDL
jgi:HAMP domain-containing protein